MANMTKRRNATEGAAKTEAVSKSGASTGPTDPGFIDDIAAQAADRMLGPNPFVGLRDKDLLASAAAILRQALSNPKLLADQQVKLGRDLLDILAGTSQAEPEPGDKRFQDAAWTSNPFYHALMQGHLAWKKAVMGFIEGSGLQNEAKERSLFVGSLVTDAFSPTNSFFGNPKAVKAFVDSGGKSVVRGLENLLRDWTSNKGMPSQVDKSAFEVGRNLAATPGSVVFRNDVLELIQYAPTTAKIWSRPIIMVPPQVNKFYVFDISPGKSMIEYLVSQEQQVFAVSWRNPTADQRNWGMDQYVSALLEAIDVACEISGSPDVNLAGACSGAMTMAALLGYLAATGRKRVEAATMMVAVLDSRAESQLGTFVTRETIAAAKQASSAQGVLEGSEMGRVFAWMRPNDLVWNYWVNNYLLGNPPPVFDILFWNNDSTRLPMRFHAQLLDIFSENLLVTPGAFEVLGRPIDLGKVEVDKYVVAGLTDHITPWKGVYNTAQAFGGTSRFILSSSGHIQSLINPPGNQKSKFAEGEVGIEGSAEWLRTAAQQAGSWWDNWATWLAARAGERRDPPGAPGGPGHPPIDSAPGRYVLES